VDHPRFIELREDEVKADIWKKYLEKIKYLENIQKNKI
jgi:hypothetical protein